MCFTMSRTFFLSFLTLDLSTVHNQDSIKRDSFCQLKKAHRGLFYRGACAPHHYNLNPGAAQGDASPIRLRFLYHDSGFEFITVTDGKHAGVKLFIFNELKYFVHCRR